MSQEQTPVEEIEKPLAVAEFKNKLTKLTKDYDMLVALNNAVAGGQAYTLSNGEIFSRATAKSYNSVFKKAILDLAKDYSSALKKKTRRGTKAMTPSFYTGEILEFINRANFGYAYEINKEGQCVRLEPLTNYLTLAKEQGIMIYNTVISLLSIYFRVHNLAHGSVITADDLMKEVFKGSFEALHQADLQKPKTKKTKEGVVELPPFDPNSMTYADSLRLGSLSLIKKENLSPEQAALLKDTNIRNEADTERNIIQSTLDCLRRQEATSTPTKTRSVRRGRIIREQAQ